MVCLPQYPQTSIRSPSPNVWVDKKSSALMAPCSGVRKQGTVSMRENTEGHTLKTLVVEGHVNLQDSHSLIRVDCKDEPFPFFLL